MATLTTAQRNKLPGTVFAGPDRSYPIPDASHARNALARASQNRKNLTTSAYDRIVAQAHRVLGK